MTRLQFLIAAAGFTVSAGAPADDAAGRCPATATFEIVEDPTFWADRCYQSVAGHLPYGGETGDAATLERDIDLDGVDEWLEVRGNRDVDRLIWVFRRSGGHFEYIGRLDASPDFYVAHDSAGELIILNVRRMGIDDVWLEHIRYADGEFQVVRRIPMQ